MDTLLLATIAFSILRLCVFFGLHVKYRELSILTNTVSDYGTGKSRSLYSVMGGLSLVAYVTLFAYLIDSSYSPSWLTTVLGIGIVGSIAILFFPTDRTGKAHTRTGRIHWLLAILNFTMLFVFMTNAQLPNTSAQVELLAAATWVVRITFYAFIVSLLLPKLRQSYVGFTERLFLTATPLWFIVFAWLLYI